MKKILLAVLLFNLNLFAQNESLETVYELFELTNTKTIMTQMIDEMIGVEIRNNPSIAQYQDVMKEFLSKKLDYDLLKEEMAKIYTNEFSQAELEELIKFYKTDVGKKTIVKMPIILQKSMMLGERAVSTYLPELQEMLNEKRKELLVENFEGTKYSNYFAYDSTFSISVPEYWDRSLQLLEGSLFQAGDISDEMYLLVIAEELTDSVEYNLTKETNEFIHNFSTTVDNFNIMDSSRNVVNSLDQRKVSFNCNSDGLDLSYYLVGIKGNKNAYLIIGWTLSELFESNRSYFEKAAITFKEEG